MYQDRQIRPGLLVRPREPTRSITLNAKPPGHQWYLQAGEAGAADKRFLEEFGNIVRWNGSFGVRLAFHPTSAGVLYPDFWLN